MLNGTWAENLRLRRWGAQHARSQNLREFGEEHRTLHRDAKGVEGDAGEASSKQAGWGSAADEELGVGLADAMVGECRFKYNTAGKKSPFATGAKALAPQYINVTSFHLRISFAVNELHKHTILV